MSISVGEDSFISVGEADSYWTGLNSESWANAPTHEKEAALRMATQYLDTRYDWPGCIAEEAQPLSWPRSDAYDLSGRKLEGIPKALQDATAYLAGYQVDGGALFTASDRGGRIDRVKAGSVEVQWNDQAPGGTEFGYLQSVLSGITYTGTSQITLTRV